MSDINVLVVFSSRHGRTERVALAAGVGAIEAEGNIRLRRLPDLATDADIDADPEWRTVLARMHRDYVAPRPADPIWADVIVVATSADRCTEVSAYLSALPSLGPMDAKVAAPLRTVTAPSSFPELCAVICRAGLMMVPALVAENDVTTAARLQGRRAVRVARQLKAGRLAGFATGE